jgi:tetratricopeptide (TPR) repeat protein
LTVQEIVAKQIVQGLRLTVSKTEAASIKASETIDPEAYEYYLRGIDLYAKNEFQLASRVLEKSVELAPNHAASWASLGRAYTANASFEFGGDESYRKAEAAFRRAIALEPNAMDARVYMANMFTDSGRVEKAVPLLREAVRVNPRHAESHWELGYAYRFAGMLEASVSECERARQLDPAVKRNSSTLNSYIYLGDYGSFLRTLPRTDDTALIAFYKGFAEYYLKQEQQAIADFDHAYELDPFILQSRVGKALSHSLRHQNARARTVLRALEQRIIGERAYDPEAVYKVAEAYAVAGDKTSALRMLRRSVETGFFPYPYLSADPLLNNLRREKEFSTLLDAARRRHEAFQKMFF